MSLLLETPLPSPGTRESGNLHAALAYAQRLGWPVFPCCWITEGSACSCGKPDCRSPGKHPLTEHGLKDATTDPEQIRDWWSKWPAANIGVPTGQASGFDVLDVDPRHGGEESLAELELLHGKLPATVEAITGGGGRHILFQHREGVSNKTGFLPGLDVRSMGSYILAAPSLHASGKLYHWELSSRPGEVELADWPSWLLDLVQPAKSNDKDPAPTIEGIIPEGQRNATLTSFAGTMRRRGMGEQAILAALKEENAEKCQPPLADREVERIAESVARYQPAENGQPQKQEGVSLGAAALIDRAGLTNEALNGAGVDQIVEWLRNLAKVVKEAGADRLLVAGVRAEAIRRLKAAKATNSAAGMVDAALGGVGDQDEGDGGQGQTLLLSVPEPWPQLVEGADLLDEIEEAFKQFVILPDRAATACALWVVFAYGHDAFTTSPILSITSPTKRCGKSTALGVLLHLVPKALPASNITPASLFRAIDRYSPSLVIDEGDTWLANGNEELRGILNSGHTKNMAYVVRCEGEDHEPRPFSTWAPKVLALIGTLPDTLQDRSINITMRRKLPGEKVARLRLDQGGEFEGMRRRAARWAQDNVSHLREADPEIPGGLNDRAADSWRPLLAIADAAGGTWPEKARQAAKMLSGDGEEREDGAPGVLLLQDLWGMFDSPQTHWLSSKAITNALAEKEDRPWPEWKQGQPITPRQLAGLLDPFGIKPNQRKDGGRVIRGYGREDFEEAWTRYVPQNPPSDPLPSATSMGDNDLQEQNIRYQAGSVADREAPQVVDKQHGSGGSGYEPPTGGDIPREGDGQAAVWETVI